MTDSMRSLNCFGVAGLLAAECEVFYTNDLRARNVGRVSDLVSAQIRGTDADELRIRALLIYGVFQAYTVRNLLPHHSEDVPPVSLEVGVDSSYIGIAIAFHWDGNHSPKWQGMVERVIGEQSRNSFEEALEWIHRHSTQLIVRYEEKERRIEVVSLLNRLDAVMKDPFEVIQVDSSSAPLLEVSNYHELGDLDYSKLLRNPSTAASEKRFSADGKSSEETVQVISGTNDRDEKTVRVNQTPMDSEVNELRTLVSDYENRVEKLKETVSELETRLETEMNRASEKHFSTGEKGADDSVVSIKGSAEKNLDKKKEDDWGLHFMKEVWPFAKKDSKAEKPEKESSNGEDEVDAMVVVGSTEASEEAADEDQVVQTEASIASKNVLEEIKELAKGKKSKKIESTLSEIEEAEGAKGKRWVDALSSELLQEKAKLAELQRNLAKQIRQRELEFKTAERSLKQELKRKDDLLGTRDTAIENKNEQIAQLNLAVERAGAGAADKEQGQAKLKLDRAQRLAQMKEEEAKALLGKVRDLENRLIISQAKAQKGTDLQMQAKVQTLEKKVDEYKRVNQRLMENLNQTKDKSGDKEAADYRRKIEQLERQSTESKRNLDKSAFRLKELQDAERKLQTDLARAVEENRNLRKNQGRGSGESGGQNAA